MSGAGRRLAEVGALSVMATAQKMGERRERSGARERAMPDIPTTTLIYTGTLIGLGLGLALTALQVWLQGDVQNDAFEDNQSS